MRKLPTIGNANTMYERLAEYICGVDKEWKERIEPASEEEMKLLTSKFSFAGFLRIDKNIAHKIVPDIETELHYEGEVKVFHCLFSDIF